MLSVHFYFIFLLLDTICEETAQIDKKLVLYLIHLSLLMRFVQLRKIMYNKKILNKSCELFIVKCRNYVIWLSLVGEQTGTQILKSVLLCVAYWALTLTLWEVVTQVPGVVHNEICQLCRKHTGIQIPKSVYTILIIEP